VQSLVVIFEGRTVDIRQPAGRERTARLGSIGEPRLKKPAGRYFARFLQMQEGFRSSGACRREMPSGR
jgi:hypothetical protein